MSLWLNKTHQGDCRDLMRRMAADNVKVQCIVTSPPYYGLRDYGVSGQIGLEPSLHDWIEVMAETFACAWNVLADDGVLWLNLGDSYAANGGAGWQGKNGQRADRRFTAARDTVGLRNANRKPPAGLKPKDMMGQPWRVAFALQDEGWYLRSDVIWSKPNPMPESTKDRPTKSHEYIFLLAKQPQYFYDFDAIKEPTTGNAHARGNGVNPKANAKVSGWAHGGGSHSTVDHNKPRDDDTKFNAPRSKQNESFSAAVAGLVDSRNVRTVWTIPSEPFPGAHFATFPRDLVRRCVLAGSRPGDVVLDPFMGSGTVAQVATDLGRQFIGCELNQKYIDLHHLRTTTQGMEL